MQIGQTLQAIISGIIQGIAELLPISSTGHVLLFSQLTGIHLAIAEVAVLHLGTVASILVIMRDKLKSVFNFKALVNIAIAIIPAGLIGLFFEDTIESKFNLPVIIAISLIFWGIVLIFVDYWKDNRNKKPQNVDLEDITPKQSLIVGIGQVLALIPGTSRSGITTVSGILAGLSPETAVNFSFLTGVPLISVTGLFSLMKITLNKVQLTTDFSFILIATIVAFIFGLVAAYLYRKFINRKILTISGIYRIILGIVVLILI